MKDLEQFSENMLEKMAVGDIHPTVREQEALARIALSAKQGKPVYQIEDADGWHDCEKEEYLSLIKSQGIPDVYYRVLYTTPQPAHIEQDGWIKCSERMPECRGEFDHKTVLISEGRNCVVAFYNKRDRKFLDEPFGFSVGDVVTHWMPLPAAPNPE